MKTTSEALLTEIYELKGSKDGPHVLILGGVHGNEQCGVEAIQTYLKNLQIVKGTLRLIIANPKAVELKQRYIEENLNRCFNPLKKVTGSYEEQLAHELKKHMDWADLCLDIHSSNSKESIPFIIAEENNFAWVAPFPFSLVVSGFDTFEPGGTDTYMHEHHKVGIGIECGYMGDVRSAELAKTAARQFLTFVGLLPGQALAVPKTFLKITSLYHNVADFTLAKVFADFEAVQKGELIGSDGLNEITAKHDGMILFARERKAGYGEAFIMLEEVKKKQ